MNRANGSRLVSATPMLVQLATGAPGVPPLQIQVWPDWQGAPSEAHALQSVLVLAIVAAHQTIAALVNRVGALEVAVAERGRLDAMQTAVEGEPAWMPPAQRVQVASRQALALAAVQSCADQIQITTTPVVTPDDTVGAPASALDLLGAEAPTPAPRHHPRCGIDARGCVSDCTFERDYATLHPCADEGDAAD